MIHRITHLDHPELAPYRTLRRPMEHFKKGIFVAEGEKVVRRLLDSGLKIVSILLTPEWYDLLINDYSCQQEPPEVYVAEKKLLETIVGFRLHQGVMAVARVPGEVPLNIAIESFTQPHLLVALNGVMSAENVGLIVRNCGAFGASGILAGADSSSPYLRRAVRNSMGAVFRLPVFSVQDLAASLLWLKDQRQTKLIAAHPHEQNSIYQTDLSGNLCFIFGSEGWGISDEILNLCDIRVAIPMRNETDSLNVAAASAIFLYEARRQSVL